MCTVTFIPSRGNFYITSNRDEKITRPNAAEPRFYRESGLIYPRDGAAGGTWFVLKENGDTAVLLNGAFEAHQPTGKYRYSRGLIMLDVMAHPSPRAILSTIDLVDIEPFTIILLENNFLYEFRWDGNRRFFASLPVDQAHIWSSATLYTEDVHCRRVGWLQSFLENCPFPTQQDIFNFHQQEAKEQGQPQMLMKGDSDYATVSITGVLLTGDRGTMKYQDRVNGKITDIKVELLSFSSLC